MTEAEVLTNPWAEPSDRIAATKQLALQSSPEAFDALLVTFLFFCKHFMNAYACNMSDIPVWVTVTNALADHKDGRAVYVISWANENIDRIMDRGFFELSGGTLQYIQAHRLMPSTFNQALEKMAGVAPNSTIAITNAKYSKLLNAPINNPQGAPAGPLPHLQHCGAGAASEGCFIATAVYGSTEAPEVLVLRAFRDEILQSSSLGVGFINAYYSLSPTVAPLVAGRPILRRLLKVAAIGPVARWALAQLQSKRNEPISARSLSRN